MQINHAENGADTSTAIRGGARDFKTLLTGDERAPDNYRVVLARQSGVVNAPRHKHNFDQIRMCLEGDRQNYGKDKWILPGEIAYFPEGTPYGPEISDCNRLGMTLQFGGASGSGFMSSNLSKIAMDEMQFFGTFEKGIFTRTGELSPGDKRNQDSYEAIWEHVNKRKLEYPHPRYDEPILMKPSNFTWQPMTGQAGVSVKHLGVFSELRTEINLLKIDRSAKAHIPARFGRQIGFVVKGDGRIEDSILRLYSAFELLAEESVSISTESGMELLLIGLPSFATQQIHLAAE